MIERLRLPPHLAASQLGHSDGGELLMRLYAHPDPSKTLEQISRAFHHTVEPPANLDEARERLNRRDEDEESRNVRRPN
jgi:hypothetical protein